MSHDPRRLAVAITLLVLAAVAPSGVAVSEEALPPNVRITRLVVRKAAHRLEAYANERRVATFRVAIGVGGEGPKVYEGDRRTPEGDYRIDRRHVSARFHRFLHVSYPNEVDRRRYEDARSRSEVPHGVGIGHSIGIHGQPDWALARLVTRHFDWTAGCIATDDRVIEWLYENVVPGAPLRILP